MRVSSLLLCALVFSCGGVPGALSTQFGSSTDCASGKTWQGGLSESEQMNPGMACRACHLGQNFQGQNPTARAEPEKAYFFMGTAYPALHEADLCASGAVPADAVVEILDVNDAVQLTLPINVAGNFRSLRTTASVPVPYKARVRAGGKVNAMAGAQTNGDCNSCHTAAGAEGAPGRVLFLQ